MSCFPPTTSSSGRRDAPGHDGTPTGVFAVDDHADVLAVVSAVVASTPGFVLRGTASDGETAVAELRGRRDVDLLLVDLHLPGIDGIEVARRVRRARPELVVVLVSSDHVDDLPITIPDPDVAAFVWKETLSTASLRHVWEATGPGC